MMRRARARWISHRDLMRMETGSRRQMMHSSRSSEVWQASFWEVMRRSVAGAVAGGGIDLDWVCWMGLIT